MKKFFYLFLVAICFVGFRASTAPGQSNLDTKIGRLVEQLDVADRLQRETASKGLLALGAPAARVLLQVCMNPKSSVETRARSLILFRNWSESTDVRLRKKILKMVSDIDPAAHPGNKFLSRLRETMLLDVSKDPQIAIRRLNKAGLEATFENGIWEIRADKWNGETDALAILSRLDSPIQLAIPAKSLEKAIDILTLSKVVSLKVMSRHEGLDPGIRIPGPVRNQELKNEVAAKLPKLESLTRLWLSRLRVNPEGFDSIGKCTGLVELQLPESVDDEDLDAIGQLHNLKKLVFHNAFQINGEGLKHLGKLKKLEWLELFYTLTESRYLSILPDFPRLKHFYAPQTTMNNRAMKFVAKVKTLEWLKLDNTLVTNRGLASLAGHPSLRELHLVSGSFSNAGLLPLTMTSGLRTVKIGGCVITEDAEKLVKKTGAGFRVSGNFFKPNSREEYEAIEELLANGFQIFQYPRPQNLTLSLYSSDRMGDPKAVAAIEKLSEITHLRLHLFGAIPESMLQAILELPPDLDIKWMQNRENPDSKPEQKWIDRMGQRFRSFTAKF